MTNPKVNHKKIANVGILFELLIRQITSDALINRPVSEAVNILQNHFKISTELGKELQLYRTLLETQRLSETKAVQFIDLVMEQRKKLDMKKLSREKYNLINEIKKHYDLKEFLSARVPEYTVHASIYKTFAAQDPALMENTIANFTDLANARFTLVEHLTSAKKKADLSEEDGILEEFKHQNHELRLLTYKLAVNKFNEKYTNLDENQKSLLREYIENMAKSNSLAKYVCQEIPKTQKLLADRIKSSTDDVLKIKLNEISSQLGKISTKKQMHDSEINALMVVYEILKELDTDR